MAEDKVSIREAVRLTFERMPDKFGILDFIAMVRTYPGRSQTTDGSITKRMRELRMDYIIDYEVKNNVYKKIALKLITVGFTSSIDLCEIPAPDLKKPITGKIVQCKLF